MRARKSTCRRRSISPVLPLDNSLGTGHRDSGSDITEPRGAKPAGLLIAVSAAILPRVLLGGAAVIAVKAEKKITLADAFRAILRAGYPQRPALADEIQSIRYFHSATIDKSTGRRNDPEAQAADDALAVLRDAVVSHSIRLRGWLGDNLPADIEHMEVAWNGIHVFDNTLEVYGERGRTLRTYRNIHCGEDEIKAILRGRTKRGAPPKVDWELAKDAFRLEVKKRGGLPNPDHDDNDWRRQADAERWVADFLDARGERVSESVIRTHVSEMLSSIEAGN
jgi:hypothetical protein